MPIPDDAPAAAAHSVRHLFARRSLRVPGTRLAAVALPAPTSPRSHWHYWWQAHYLDCLLDEHERGTLLGGQRGERVEHPPALLDVLRDGFGLVVVHGGRHHRAAVLDVGVARRDGKIAGDVHRDVAEVAGWLTPNPGGVGPMTRAMLLTNVVEAAERVVARTR